MKTRQILAKNLTLGDQLETGTKHGMVRVSGLIANGEDSMYVHFKTDQHPSGADSIKYDRQTFVRVFRSRYR